MALLKVVNLRKSYRQTTAVHDVSFNVEEGCCFGLLGPNGAGKTTTMEMIEGIIEPSSGLILYEGKERDASFREAVGIQFQHTSLLNFLTVQETLECYRRLYRNKEELGWLIDRCDLNPILDRRNNQLSGGQQQRLMLALALLNRPNLIFLDEPSTGLDPQSRRHLWEIIRDIKASGKTIIMTTHAMEEAEILCDEIAIVDQGRIIAQGNPTQLVSSYCKTNTINLSYKVVEKQLPCLTIPFTVNGSAVTIQTTHVDKTLVHLLDCGIDLSEMTIRSANLEDVFLQLTGRSLRD